MRQSPPLANALAGLGLAYTALSGLPAMAEPASELSDSPIKAETVERYAQAYVTVQQIAARYEAELTDMGQQKPPPEMRERMNEDLVAAVEETGMEINTYNSLYHRIAGNDELRQRVMDEIEEVRGEQQHQ